MGHWHFVNFVNFVYFVKKNNNNKISLFLAI